MLTSLPLAKEVVLLAKHNFSPVFLSSIYAAVPITLVSSCFITLVSSCFFIGLLASRSFSSNLFLTMEALMFTPDSPIDCFSAELVFLGYFLLSLISPASLFGDVSLVRRISLCIVLNTVFTDFQYPAEPRLETASLQHRNTAFFS